MTDGPPGDLPDALPDGPGRPRRRALHGRSRGKALRPAQRALLGAPLDAVRLRAVSREENPGREPIPLPGEPLWVEIGFGGGEHLAHVARLHPEATILGAEPFVNGLASAMRKLGKAGVGNVRIHPGDALDLLEVLPAGSVSRAFLLYPDPWPKARHRKRRFVNPGPLGLLARALAPGAEWRLATDIAGYAEQALEEAARAGFAPEADGAEPWADWTPTRYEAKALREGRAPRYLTFRRP